MKDKEDTEYEDILSVFRTFANAVKYIHACDGQFLLIDKINHYGFIEGFELLYNGEVIFSFVNPRIGNFVYDVLVPIFLMENSYRCKVDGPKAHWLLKDVCEAVNLRGILIDDDYHNIHGKLTKSDYVYNYKSESIGPEKSITLSNEAASIFERFSLPWLFDHRIVSPKNPEKPDGLGYARVLRKKVDRLCLDAALARPEDVNITLSYDFKKLDVLFTNLGSFGHIEITSYTGIMWYLYEEYRNIEFEVRFS